MPAQAAVFVKRLGRETKRIFRIHVPRGKPRQVSPMSGRCIRKSQGFKKPLLNFNVIGSAGDFFGKHAQKYVTRVGVGPTAPRREQRLLIQNKFDKTFGRERFFGFLPGARKRFLKCPRVNMIGKPGAMSEQMAQLLSGAGGGSVYVPDSSR